MKTNVSVLHVAVICTALTACQSRAERNGVAPESKEALAPTSEISIRELEPADHLYQALEAFTQGEFGKSAADIREAAQAMRVIADHETHARRKQAIENAARGLDSEANKVSKKEVKDIGELYPSFGRTGRALAGNRLSITENEYFNKSEGKSGTMLATTVKQLEKSITTHHRALKADEKQVLNDALAVAKRLERGEKVEEDELKGAIQSLNMEIEKWDKEFAPL
jgi:hypothetical protein